MSATFRWIPKIEKGEILWVGSTDSFVTAMEQVFGYSPWILDESSVPRLDAMSAVYRPVEPNPYDTLVDIINRVGPIRVWGEY